MTVQPDVAGAPTAEGSTGWRSRGWSAEGAGSAGAWSPVNSTRTQRAKRASEVETYVPTVQEDRYSVWAAVSESISTPMVSSLRRAISRSISTGTSYTVGWSASR